MLVYFFDAKLLTFYLVTKKITDCITANPFNPSASAEMVTWWEQFYPPNGWNRRCSVSQVRKSKFPATPHNEAMALGEVATQRDTRQMFRFNPGKEQKTFPDYNSYTISRCKTCKLTNSKLAKGIPDNDLCAACRIIHEKKNIVSERIKQNRNLYKKLLEDHDYTDVEFDETTGGVKATHKDHNFDKKRVV